MPSEQDRESLAGCGVKEIGIYLAYHLGGILGDGEVLVLHNGLVLTVCNLYKEGLSEE